MKSSHHHQIITEQDFWSPASALKKSRYFMIMVATAKRAPTSRRSKGAKTALLLSKTHRKTKWLLNEVVGEGRNELLA